MFSILNTTDNKQTGQSAEVRIKGKTFYVPSAKIGDRMVVVTRRLPRVASIKDEEFIQGESVSEPQEFIKALKRNAIHADLFTFVQKFPDVTPRYDFQMDWDNVAAIPVKSYQDWFEKRLSTTARKNLRRAERRGVQVEQVELSDQFIREVLDIYNELPVRQGRKFWHFGKDFETVKREISTYQDRSIFFGAFYDERLIGFIKLVFVDKLARLMHIVSMAAHNDKRPTNSLIAKAVEICEREECSHLTYGKYFYGRNSGSSLTEFKNRNGFECVLVPRYYIPFTTAGRIALKLGIQQGIKCIIPECYFRMLLSVRRQYNRLIRSQSR